MRYIDSIGQLFAPAFDHEIYRNSNRDLRKMSDAQLEEHYGRFGRNEGRVCSRVRDRNSFITVLPGDLRVLEIGPFTKPIVSSSQTDYFDVLSTEDLCKRAEQLGLDPGGVPEIRWVSPLGSLEIVTETYDVVISSHAIEHQVDLVRHLREVEAVLRPGGAYLLVVPDKRYCFDQSISESSIADVLDAHISGRTKHDIRSVIEHLALTTHNDPHRHWRGDSARAPISASDIQAAITRFRESDGGIDVHSWQFTPEAFADVLRLLNELNLISLSCQRLYPTVHGSLEFFAMLALEDL
jgi:SAM-dependent methyltransferase